MADHYIEEQQKPFLVELKASDLRIGNWVLCNGVPIKIESIGERGINIYASNDYGTSILEAEYSLYELRPIPITPELLEKCGFERISSATGLYALVFGDGESFFISYKSGRFYQSYEGEFDVDEENTYASGPMIDFGAAMSFLHELQNRVYSFTGEELEVNL